MFFVSDLLSSPSSVVFVVIVSSATTWRPLPPPAPVPMTPTTGAAVAGPVDLDLRTCRSDYSRCTETPRPPAERFPRTPACGGPRRHRQCHRCTSFRSARIDRPRSARSSIVRSRPSQTFGTICLDLCTENNQNSFFFIIVSITISHNAIFLDWRHMVTRKIKYWFIG